MREAFVRFGLQVPEGVVRENGQPLVHDVTEPHLNQARQSKDEGAQFLVKLVELEGGIEIAPGNERLGVRARKVRAQVDFEPVVVGLSEEILRLGRISDGKAVADHFAHQGGGVEVRLRVGNQPVARSVAEREVCPCLLFDPGSDLRPRGFYNFHRRMTRNKKPATPSGFDLAVYSKVCRRCYCVVYSDCPVCQLENRLSASTGSTGFFRFGHRRISSYERLSEGDFLAFQVSTMNRAVLPAKLTASWACLGARRTGAFP